MTRAGSPLWCAGGVWLRSITGAAMGSGRLLVLGMLAVGIAVAGCGSDLLGGGLASVAGSSFVLRGTSAVVDGNEPCLVWLGETGTTYHLFQGIGLPNEDFDRVTVPGTSSRLVIAIRDDLEVGCQMGTIAEVQRVLEILD